MKNSAISAVATRLMRGFHALRFDYRKCRRPAEKPDQVFCRFRLPRRRADARVKCNVGLDFCRQWADELDPLCRHDLSDNHHAKFDIPFGDELGNDIGFRARHF